MKQVIFAYLIDYQKMTELLFIVSEAAEGGYTAQAVGHSIFTEADTMEELKEMVSDAVKCHFEADELPKVIRLHYTKEEVFALVA